jgi:hypothetical protein
VCLGIGRQLIKHNKQGDFMSKKEKIIALIEDESKSFEEIVVESGAKASYVKSIFTQLDKNWEDRDDPAVELKTEIVETEELEILEVADEDIPEDAEVLEQGIEIVEVEETPADPTVFDEDVDMFLKQVRSAQLVDARKRRQLPSQVRKLIITDLMTEKPGRNEIIIRRICKRSIRTKQQKYILKDLIKDVEKYLKIVK